MAKSVGSASRRKTIDMDAYWRANLRIIATLLAIWFAVSYLPVLLVNQLNQVSIFTGFPLGYYMGSQGSLIVFVVEIFYYSWRMQKLDREFGLNEE